MALAKPAMAAPRADWLSAYNAPAACPTREAAEARLAAHLEDVASVRSVLVTLAVEGGGEGKAYRGTLDTIDAGGERARRELADASCSDVVWSLVFIAALAISPDAKPFAAPAPAPPPPPPPAAPPPPPAVVEPPLPPPVVVAAPPRRASLEVGALARLGVLPDVAFGAEVRGAYRPVALAIGFATAPSVDASSGAADFWLFTARAAVCPLAFERGVRIEGCAGVEAGVLHASSSGLVGERSVNALWLAPEVAIRASVPLTQAVFVAAELRGGVPLHRPSFVTGPPETTVYEVAPITGSLGISAGYAW